ncbi:hypothetical protein BVE84_05660 [Streptococcus azizii]|uniref:Uncharacterized protein n=2 Tax=Streptococcus TaxID=1301 RepID=A0AB36JPM3_9STRE|nr:MULTISPECIES: hypothetical protein [Streptococcus]QBX22510.1 hypothetical protein Javan85_0013 [Streptococcus phage Javan85]QBX31923.1 hypothetical protein Javan84_0046 [Streptococcus phage Javan84]MBF0775993.1 hypothetical protein [Streptococcus sp. 19428wD3_AN2]ONK26328.1 hypothetical protein BVE86_07600 [Streptococcus azizii]ONK28187.1 hypothetical protein BVE85_05065 [Streptococcus azizii]
MQEMINKGDGMNKTYEEQQKELVAAGIKRAEEVMAINKEFANKFNELISWAADWCLTFHDMNNVDKLDWNIDRITIPFKSEPELQEAIKKAIHYEIKKRTLDSYLKHRD